MLPHSMSPHAVFPHDPPTWRDALYPPSTNGQHFHGTSMAELLAEPKALASTWLPALYARLVVASTGPVLIGGENAGATRLEKARWLRVTPDADLARVRAAAWPALPEVARLRLGVGSLAPDLVVVAERDPYDRLPMFARSGAWLWRALRHLGYDEFTVYITNALDKNQRGQGYELSQLRDAFAPYGPQWLALGSIAHDILANSEIEHITAQHPGQARKFSKGDGPEGYAATLRAAGLHTGPWAPGALPVTPSPSSPLVERLSLPADANLRPGELARPRQNVPLPLLDEARQKFVLGEAATLKDAAKMVTDDKRMRSAIVKLARQQGWEVERERYFADKREKIKASSAEEEVKAISKSRSLAWTVTEKMLQKLNEQMDSAESPTVFAKDAKAMVELSNMLSQKGDTMFEEEKDRLAKLSPEAFSKELRRVLGDGFGVQPEAAPAPPPPPPPA